jgi:hypothetical protein
MVEDMSGKIDAILDGGSCGVGVESTIIDLTSNPPRLLRPGGLPLEALEEVLATYGTEAIHRLGLDVYGGSYNYRATSSEAALSMHAWGIALDFAPATNAYHTRAPRATLSHPDCTPWWQIWESHGATSLGRSCGYDWMHLQFAKLR